MATQKSFLHAVKWAYIGNWGERMFSALFTFVLAAVLGPRDFGTVSIALIYIAFLQMFLDQGLVAALIQRKNLDREHCDAVFWMDMALSVVLAGLSVVLSHWWGRVNHAPDLGPIISILSLCIPIEAFAVVQKALLSRDMDFRAMSIRSNVSVVASGVVGIILAFAGFGVWSLVVQQILRDFTALVLLWRLSSWRPRFEFSWKHLKDLMHFSISNFVGQFAIFADQQAGSILLGIFFGPVAVGLYRIAERLVNSVVAMATSSIQAVSLPEFSRHQDNPVELRKSAISCVRLSSAMTIPALAGLAAVSGPIMAVLGSKWLPASNVLKILAVLGMSAVFAYFTGPLLQALSRPHHLAVLEWARSGVGVVFLAVAGYFVRGGTLTQQIVGLSLARFVPGVFIVMPVFLYLLMHLCGISFRDLAAAVAPSAIASVGLVAAILLFSLNGWAAYARPITVLVAEIAVGGTVGLALLILLDKQLRSVILKLQQRMFGNLPAVKETA
jgi:O-antigen/teichoic acid export membrane protein